MTAKEKAKQIKCYCGHTTYCDCGPLEEPLKETLEEAAKNETKIYINEREKQTAVEWLIEQWPILESQLPDLLIEQAKAMEREQIHAEYMRGWKDGLTSSSGVTYRCCGLRLSIHGCGCPQETYKSE